MGMYVVLKNLTRSKQLFFFFPLQMQKDLFLFGETVKDYIALLASIRVSG